MINKNLLKLAERYANDKIPEKKIEESKKENLEKILKYVDGKPKLELKEIENTVVNALTQKDYDTLMQVYESGGWKWRGKEELLETNHWRDYKKQTCIRIRDNFTYAGINDFKEAKILPPQEFYKIQNISNEMLKELNEWFDENEPNRESKG